MRLKVTGGMLAVAAVLATLVPAASAQTGNYPPAQCQVLFSSTANVAQLGIGGTITILLTPQCTWAPGAGVTVTVNGQFIEVKQAAANGTVSVLVTALSASQLSIDDPVLVPAQCGTNTVRGVGASTVAGGQTVTHDATFQLLCPAATVTPTPSRSVAFTGYNVVRALAAALVLAAVGGLLVAAGKRRKGSGAAA